MTPRRHTSVRHCSKCRQLQMFFRPVEWVMFRYEGNQVGEAEYSHVKPVRTKETLLKDMMELNSKSINALNS